VPPLIKIKLLLNDTLEISGIYDSGSNVSLINAKLLKKKQKEKNERQVVNLRTINGVKKTNGMVTLKIKIYNIEKTMDIFVVENENFNYDFLIGLDCIKKFKLIQNEDLRITQYNNSIKENTYNNVSTPDSPSGTQEEEETNERIYKHKINFNEHINANNFEISINHLDLKSTIGN